MSISHIFEDFTAPDAEDSPAPATGEQDDQYEEMRLAEFERGYSAGWEDAVKAQTEMKTHLTAELARNLEDLSFTYHEAIAQMTVSVEPVFRTLADIILPAALEESFRAHLVELLRTMVKDTVSGPVIITVPPGCSAGLDDVIGEALNMPLEIREDATLAPGQADLSIGSVERALDTGRLLTDLTTALDAFFYQSKKDSANG
ncbi:ABC transporter ATP-binding protein [Arenibacterium halophilum]|uniref:ABC transporter ATP-binding protein n=1 Tax=Arenibacterium halophilum TaxID=2583821 RepID=A0ABY2X6B9_9RHOB|nr:ABC transporter ATP-binding protein [Arenibacterium halophilum]TMV10648.1 ABC transporter ATP-binding protein [Arenibacterium halophilum]